MNNAVFPLHLLPDNVRLQVIKNFDHLQLIFFSLLSRKSKALVQSFNLKIEKLTVSAPDSLSIFIEPTVDESLIEFSIYRGKGRMPISLDAVSSYVLVEAASYEQHVAFQLFDQRLSFNEWFQHLRSLFKCEINKIVISKAHEKYDPVALRNLLPQWSSLEIERGSHDYVRRILDVFCPCVKVIEAGSDIHLQELPQKVSIQNLDIISIGKAFTLDDALSSNAVHISLIEFTVTDVNRFLRSWVRGSNPRMRSAYIRLIGPLHRGKLLKGIPQQAKPVEIYHMLDEYGRVREGVRSKKGIPATLITDRNIYRNYWTIEMSVGN